uniref:polysaccharide deacetylase family protein n=1 Tax=Haloarcula amylovorans TaxID=2562280 RepID=UPI0010767E42|nr:polysaccharide deacetylase family protein [Halomicroarcula amylolytica]
MTASETSSNALGFDLEHWYTATLLSESVSDPTDHVESSVDIVLGLLSRHDVRATFFVVGEVAATYPDLVARIADAGHELASHGQTHTPLFDLDRAQFADELRQSRIAIREASGVEPAGFRAPNFSVTEETAWALDVLQESNYEYDSSVFPVRTPMYGVSGAPRRPYVVERGSPFTAGAAGGDGLLEFPLAVAESRYRFPVAGGFYARVLPTRLLERGIRRLNRRGIPANLYFHPWEFNPAVQTSEPPLKARLISFYGLGRLSDSLESLLKSFELAPVGRVLGNQPGVDFDAPTRGTRRGHHHR